MTKKMETYAESQYKIAFRALREIRLLDAKSEEYQSIDSWLSDNVERSYISAAWSSIGFRGTRLYELRPIYHRSANVSKVWLRLREWRKREGIEPSHPVDYI